MTGRGMVVLLVLAAALGTYYYFWEVRGAASRKVAEEEAGRVFHLEAGEVQEIERVSAGDTLLLRRRGDRWELRRPLEAPADQSLVENALTSLLAGKRETVIEESAEDLAPYGLDPPAMELVLRTAEPGEEHRLLVGDFNPTRSFAYARRPDTAQVLLVTSSVKSALDGRPDDLRDRTVMDLELGDVERLVLLERGEEKVAVERAGERAWRLTSPLSCRADRVMVEQTLRQLRSARVEEFVGEDPESLERYGLESPELTVRVELGEDRATKVLHVGEAAGEERGRYAKRDERPDVFLLPDDSLIRFLRRDALELRAKTLVDFEYADVARIRLTSADSAWVLRRDSAEGEEGISHTVWTSEATGEEVPSNKMSDILWELKRLRYAEVVAESVEDPAAYGLSPALLGITLWGEGGEELAVLVLGEEREGTDEFYAMNGVERVLYSVSRRSAESLPRSLGQLLESAGPGAL